MLKQMGGCFALIGKERESPLHKEQKLYLEEIELVEVMMISHNCIPFYYNLTKELVKKMNTYACFVEKCNSMIDFRREKMLKPNMFGKDFENHDCPEFTRCFLNAITLSQTFNDDFIFTKGDQGFIPLGRWQTSMYGYRKPRNIIPPCEMIRLRLIMVSFMHKEIMHSREFINNVGKEDIQKFMGINVFFMIV